MPHGPASIPCPVCLLNTGWPGSHQAQGHQLWLCTAPSTETTVSTFALGKLVLWRRFLFFGCFIDIDCTFFFKFLRITELPLYTGYTIIPAPYNARSPLNLLVLSRAGPVAAWWWQQICGGAQARGSLPTEATVGMVTFPGPQPLPSPGAGLAQRLSWPKTASWEDWPRVSYATLSWQDPLSSVCFPMYFSRWCDDPNSL